MYDFLHYTMYILNFRGAFSGVGRPARLGALEIWGLFGSWLNTPHFA